MDHPVVRTARLRLLAPAAAVLEADAKAGAAGLAAALNVEVAPDWPPDTWDAPTAGFLAVWVHEHPDERAYGPRYILTHGEVVIGTVGGKGAPRNGEVEVGYSLVASAQGRGLATEAARGLIDAWLREPTVTRVIAHTRPDGLASQAVLRRLGFQEDGVGEEPHTRRFVLERQEGSVLEREGG